MGETTLCGPRGSSLKAAYAPVRHVPVMDHFVARLQLHTRLDGEAKVALAGSVALSHVTAARDEVPVSGLGLVGVYFVQHGFACHHSLLADGRRQMIRLLLPGDICVQQADCAKPGNPRTYALSKVTCGLIPHRTLLGLTGRFESIAAAFARALAVERAMLHERVISLGQRTARERLAHLLCESFLRSQEVGLAVGTQCSFPVSQADLSKLLGLSHVHAHRSLQAIRAEGLVRLDGGVLTILDLDRLKDVANSDFSYLRA